MSSKHYTTTVLYNYLSRYEKNGDPHDYIYLSEDTRSYLHSERILGHLQSKQILRDCLRRLSRTKFLEKLLLLII